MFKFQNFIHLQEVVTIVAFETDDRIGIHVQYPNLQDKI